MAFGGSIKEFEHTAIRGAGYAVGAIVGLMALAKLMQAVHGVEGKVFHGGWYDYF